MCGASLLSCRNAGEHSARLDRPLHRLQADRRRLVARAMGIGISFPGVSRVNPSTYPDDVRWTITEYGRNLVEAFRSNKHVYAVMAGSCVGMYTWICACS